MAADSLEVRRADGWRRLAPKSEASLLSVLVPPAVATTLFSAWMDAFQQSLNGPHFLLGLLALLAASEVVSTESYSRRSAGSARAELLRLTWRWAIVAFVAWAGIVLSGIGPSLNLEMLVCVAGTMPLALWGGQEWVARWITMRSSSPAAQRRAIVIGVTDVGARWEESLLQSKRLGIKIEAFFDDRKPTRLKSGHQAMLAGKLADVPRYVADNGIQIVYITLPISRHPRILKVLSGLRDSTVSVYFLPDIFALNPMGARFECVNGVPLLAVQESPFAGPSAAVKRLVDIVVSTVAIAILAPLMVILAALILISSRGPVIFSQHRYGLDGRAIAVYKFRTMTVVEDGASSYTQVQRGDTRVTPLGAVLRTTSLDELPQLFNVLLGTMSIVGPRPHAIAVNEQYRRMIPSYMLRHKVKPGITGLAQVRGFRGGDDLPGMTKRIENDLEYIQHWSLSLDFMIMARTAAVIWNDRNAY